MLQLRPSARSLLRCRWNRCIRPSQLVAPNSSSIAHLDSPSHQAASSDARRCRLSAYAYVFACACADDHTHAHPTRADTKTFTAFSKLSPNPDFVSTAPRHSRQEFPGPNFLWSDFPLEQEPSASFGVCTRRPTGFPTPSSYPASVLFEAFCLPWSDLAAYPSSAQVGPRRGADADGGGSRRCRRAAPHASRSLPPLRRHRSRAGPSVAFLTRFGCTHCSRCVFWPR